MASFGEELRREREARGIALRDVAESTRVPLRYLEALERDELEGMPGGVIARGFVRAYVRHLGLEEQTVTAAFERYQARRATPAARPGERPGGSSPEDARPDDPLSTLAWVALLVGVVLWLLLART